MTLCRVQGSGVRGRVTLFALHLLLFLLLFFPSLLLPCFTSLLPCSSDGLSYFLFPALSLYLSLYISLSLSVSLTVAFFVSIHFSLLYCSYSSFFHFFTRSSNPFLLSHFIALSLPFSFSLSIIISFFLFLSDLFYMFFL